MQHGTWGRKNEREARACAPGDVFFMHVTGGGGVRTMGMFTGEPYFDDVDPLWRDMDGKGAFPWRIRFVPLGELRVGIPTKAVLEPLHVGAAKNWFHGFIQASHSLDPADFEALRAAFEPALRADRGIGR